MVLTAISDLIYIVWYYVIFCPGFYIEALAWVTYVLGMSDVAGSYTPMTKSKRCPCRIMLLPVS